MVLHRADILEEDKSLIIKNVLPSDEGIYICEAHNSVGQISARAQLGVNCKLQVFVYLTNIYLICSYEYLIFPIFYSISINSLTQ